MIDQPVSAPVAQQPDHGSDVAPAQLPVPPGLGRLLVLGSVFICAACGLVYELELVALASYLVGDSVTQASIVLSVMVFAMGIGSLLAKRLCYRAAAGFGFIEALLALIGGVSAMALYACFAWFGESRIALVGFSLAIGVLIGAEMPLLMTLIQRVRAQDAGGAVADLFAADYVGALVGGLAFPFLLLPFLGQLTGALLVGVVNTVAGGVVVLWLFRHDLSAFCRGALLVVNIGVVVLLAAAAAFAGSFEEAARRAVYGGDVRVAMWTDVQEIVLTEGRGDGEPGEHRPHGLELFIDGRLRVCSADEARYHQALVHPAMASGPHARVLILGGGDGLALREVLRYDDVRAVTVVDIDPGVIELARTDPPLSALNEGSLDDPRVRIETADAFHWLRGGPGPGEAPYDVIISGLPDPRITASTKLYSQEFYGLVRRSLADDGRVAVHAGSPVTDRRAFWTVDATLRTAGLHPTPYAVDGRVSGFTSGPDRSQNQHAPGVHPTDRRTDWGFLLAAPGTAPPLTLPPGDARPKALTEPDLHRAAIAAERQRMPDLPPSTLMHPRYLG
ncbi:polyamine aminopropyltransferase [Streptomyces gobiensis]|uniref:polyamine aminopropyltransferase n=1 Tax=Streptomyces gobiensis TaxID=2875706 RepID=UPI001E4004D5|nr:polyamine aminopropyltransferase [Streptomyces gobiensis]UGY92712.1 polyamine aminopropyltransferase [Streptomyces gobiensis]